MGTTIPPLTDEMRLLGAEVLVKPHPKTGRPRRYDFGVLSPGDTAFILPGTYSSAQAVRAAADQFARRHAPLARFSIRVNTVGLFITRHENAPSIASPTARPAAAARELEGRRLRRFPPHRLKAHVLARGERLAAYDRVDKQWRYRIDAVTPTLPAFIVDTTDAPIHIGSLRCAITAYCRNHPGVDIAVSEWVEGVLVERVR